MIPDEAFYKSLGRPPWSHDAILSALKDHGVTRVMPLDCQSFIKCSPFEPGGGIIQKIEDAGIVFDKGDGERLC